MKLKACPFCGVAPYTYNRIDESLFSSAMVEWLTISCPQCDISMRSEYSEDLIIVWNTRKRSKIK